MLGFFPKDISLYEQALLHKSVLVKSDKGRPLNNERLEFLGDAILDAIVADIVFKKFKGKREGFLTNTRSKIVQRETLNHIGKEIGLEKLIKFNNQRSSHNSYLCGNAFEALIGAIYLDRGYRACKSFMEDRILSHYINLEKLSRKEVNFKSRLIEWCQKNRMAISFELINGDFDKTNSPIFECNVMIEDIISGYGRGYSKKESHQNAAHEAYSKIKNNTAFTKELFAIRDKMLEEEQEDTTIETENITDAEPVIENIAETDFQENTEDSIE
jgi:ribonuclease III, bacterial